MLILKSFLSMNQCKARKHSINDFVIQAITDYTCDKNLIDCFSIDTQTQKPDCVAWVKSKQTVEPSAYILASLTFLTSSIQSYGQTDHRCHIYLAKEP